MTDQAAVPAIPGLPIGNADPEPAAAVTPRPPIEVAPQAYISAADAPSWDELAARFRPIFARIAEGAIEREQKRELAYEPVAWLRKAGFGAVRIPKAYGGLGATLQQFFRLLLELADADSNVSHLFRGHFAWLEARLNLPEPETHARWFPEVAKGVIFGYAMAEPASQAGNAKLIREDGKIFIDGIKYYSTGTIYADWIVAGVPDGEQHASVLVPSNAPGVTRLDDWDGFGQRLTGSGTTKFDRVQVNEDQVVIFRRKNRNTETSVASAPAATENNSESSPPVSPASIPGSVAAVRGGFGYITSFLQLVLLTSMAGSARAALREGVAFVLPRKRTFNQLAGNGRALPKDDPLVQRVVGKVSSLVYSVETHVLALAQHLEHLYQLAQQGKATEADYAATEVKAFQTQQIVIPTALEATTLIFEVGGASATSASRQLDRHWRNARTAASHNPAIQRERAIGDYFLNGVAPGLEGFVARDAQRVPAPEVENGEPATDKAVGATKPVENAHGVPREGALITGSASPATLSRDQIN